eukprot:3793821-Heterocapsa_arctica.AAC.1
MAASTFGRVILHLANTPLHLHAARAGHWRPWPRSCSSTSRAGSRLDHGRTTSASRVPAPVPFPLRRGACR